MYKKSLHNCIVHSVLTCLAGGDCEHTLAPSGSASEDCTANFCFFIYRQQCAFRGAAKRNLDSDMRAAVPQVKHKTGAAVTNVGFDNSIVTCVTWE